MGALWDTNVKAQAVLHNYHNALIAPHFWRDLEVVEGNIAFNQYAKQLQFALDYNMDIATTALIYRTSTSPAWVTGGSWTRSTLLQAMHDFIVPMVRFLVSTGRVYVVDVVNEALVTPLGSNIFRQIIGFPDYVIAAFRFAQKARDGADLLLRINEDFGTANGAPSRVDAMLALLDVLADSDVKPDVLGVESHLRADTIISTGSLYLDNLQRMLDGCQQRDMIVHISEMDMNQDTQDFFTQALFYDQYFRAAYAHPACRSFSTWGVYDGNTWLSSSFPNAKPLLFDTQFNPKLAYEAVNTAIREIV